MEDVFGVPPMGTVSLGTGPGVISSQPDKFSYDTNGYTNNSSGRDQGFRPRQQQGSFTQNSFYQNKHFNNQSYNRQQQNNNQFNQQQNYNNAGNKDLAPRFKKLYPVSNSDEISLRPSATMSLKPKTPGVLPQSALDSSNHNDGHNNVLPVAPQLQPPNRKPTPPLLHKDPPILIKQVSVEKPKSNKREKNFNRETAMQRASSLLRDYIGEKYPDLIEGMANYHNSKFPERFAADVAQQFFLDLLKEDESKRENGTHYLISLTPRYINNTKIMEGLKRVLDQLDDLTVELPRSKSHLAGIIGLMIASDKITLSDIADLLEGGQHYPLFFLILQTLHKIQGKPELTQTFNNSKVNILLIVSCIFLNKHTQYSLFSNLNYIKNYFKSFIGIFK